MYRLGFRALEEVAEAGVEELTAVPGIGNAEAAGEDQAERRDDHGAPPSRADRHARAKRPSRSPKASVSSSFKGSGSVPSSCSKRLATAASSDVLREDEDKLAIRTGLGIKKARAIAKGAQYFIENEQKLFEAARAQAKKGSPVESTQEEPAR